MYFITFLNELYNLINKPNSDIKVIFDVKKDNNIDILVSVHDDVIIDTSINTKSSSDKNKMKRIVYAINEYCEYEYC